MTAIPSTSRASGLHGASTVLLGSTAALVVLDVVTALMIGGADPLVFGLLMLAYAGMVVAGAILLHDAHHAGLGRLVLGVAATGTVYDICGWLGEIGPFRFLSGIVYWGYAGLIAHLALRWPDDRLAGRLSRALVLVVVAVMPALTLLWQLTWDPRWFDGGAGGLWWPTVLPAQVFSTGVWEVQQVLFIALIAALAVVVIVRAAIASGPRRRAMVPVTVVVVALGAVVILEVVQSVGGVSVLDPGLLEAVALLAIPVAVLIAAVREPAVVGESAMPGRRRLDEGARERYRLGLAAIGAALVVLAAIGGVAAGGGWSDRPVTADGPAPQPGPALVP